MELSTLEQLVLAHYVATEADQLKMVPRRWPYGELVLIIEDKIRFACLPFGARAMNAAARPAAVFVDKMIACGGFDSVANSFGGTMHRQESGRYAECLREWRQAGAPAPASWEAAFAAVT